MADFAATTSISSRQKYYREWRARIIAALGGCCVKCGAKERLEFDHEDAKTKGFDISNKWGYSLERQKEELAKLQLLCAPCHREKSYQSGDLPKRTTHGTYGHYRHAKCRCDACREAASIYQRERRLEKLRRTAA